MSSWFSPLMFLLAGSSEQQLRRHVEFLKAENEMLRKRVDKSRVFLTNEERERLLKLGESIGKGVFDLITIVSPRTYQRWRSRVSRGKKPTKKMGRKGTPETLRQLVVRLAKENTWGYGRIVGELKKLRVQGVGRTTVRTILKEEGIYTGPERGKGTWDEFIKIHAETLWQVDFFTKPVITKTGVKQAFVLAFLHVQSRRVICSPATFHPDDAWMRSQAESMLDGAKAAELPIKHLVRDKDFKYRDAFDGAFEAADVAVQPTAPRAPNQNAFIERWVGSIKGECLNRFFAFGLRHLDYLTAEYVRFYNEQRPHSRKENKPLVGVWSDLDDPPDDPHAIICEQRLGGVLKHYERRAA